MRKLPPNRKVRVLIDSDLALGDYDIRYENVSHPGEGIDFTELMNFLRKVFAQEKLRVDQDADEGTTGQAKREGEDFH